MDLPPELRNIIYSNFYSFAERPTDLFKADPPTNDLILVCRQTYLDARCLYRHAFRRYWITTRFWTKVDSGKTIADVQKRLEILGLRNLDQIRFLEIKARFALIRVQKKLTWVHNQKYWHDEAKNIGEDSWRHHEYFFVGPSTESHHKMLDNSVHRVYNDCGKDYPMPLSEQIVWILGRFECLWKRADGIPAGQ